MAKRPKYREDEFPVPGTIFAAPTQDGRFSAGRVVRRAFHGGAQGALIAATPWLDNELPPLDSPALRATLILKHHSWEDHPEILWVQDLMPSEFIIIGQIDLSADDLTATSDAFGGWQSVPIQALKQWRWDHDRAALLRDEAQQKAEQAELQRQRAAAQAELMRTLTLDSLVDRTWFTSWENAGSNIPLGECRSLIVNFVNALRSGPKLTMAAARRHLKQSVQEFNRLDAENHFISTLEREDLYEAYEQIMCAAKFPQVVDQIDQWRDW